MENYPDLNTMFQNGMNSYAAGIAGERSADARKMNEMLLQKQAIDNQKNEQMNPLDVMFRKGQVESQAAELPGKIGQSQLQGVQGRVAAAGEQDSIFANKDAAAIKRIQNMNEQLPNISATIRQIPAAGRAAAAQQMAVQLGVPQNSAMMKQILSGDPEQLPDVLDRLHKHISLNSAKHLQEMEKENAKDSSAERRTQITADASRENTRTRAEASATALRSKQAAAAAKDPVQKMTFLSQTPEDMRDAGWTQQWNEALEMVKLQGAAKQNPLAAEVLKGGKPTTSNDIAGGLRRPTNQPVAPVQDYTAQAKAIWPNDDPSKYEYKVKNGELYRKPR